MATSSQPARPAPATRGEGDARLGADEPLARLASLFAEHGRRLERLAAPLLRGSGAAPEDVVGDVVLRYAERLAQGAAVPGDEPAYLARMVRNRCLDLQREASRRGRPVEHDDAVAASASSAEEVALRRERLAGMVEDLALLPERQRQAILDVSVGGLSHRDAALRDDATVQTSKSLLARAVRNLRALQSARQAPCEDVRTELHAARDEGHRPAESVRRHLRVCPPCRLDDARLRGTAGRSRLGALLGGWIHWPAELLHAPAAGPVAKSIAATAAIIVAVPLATSPEERPASPERTHGDIAAAPAAAPAPAPRPPADDERPPATPRPASRAAERPAPARVPARETEIDRTGAWRGLRADLDRGEPLGARSEAALQRWCTAAGEKGLVGTKALSEGCPKAKLDTPKRRAKVRRVEERRRKDARRREAPAPASTGTLVAQPGAAPPPAPAVVAEPAPPPPPPASDGPEPPEPTRNASGPTPLDMTPNVNEKPPPQTEPDMQTSGGETDPDEENPDELPGEGGAPQADLD